MLHDIAWFKSRALEEAAGVKAPSAMTGAGPAPVVMEK